MHKKTKTNINKIAFNTDANILNTLVYKDIEASTKIPVFT